MWVQFLYYMLLKELPPEGWVSGVGRESFLGWESIGRENWKSIEHQLIFATKNSKIATKNNKIATTSSKIATKIATK